MNQPTWKDKIHFVLWITAVLIGSIFVYAAMAGIEVYSFIKKKFKKK